MNDINYPLSGTQCVEVFTTRVKIVSLQKQCKELESFVLKINSETQELKDSIPCKSVSSLSSIECMEILATKTEISILKQQCEKFESLLSEMKAEIEKLDNSMPYGWKLGQEDL
tara:strand:- start:398 stop:739 length:342 start_codon:yes stop_codon:yes gene_type:complete